LLDPGPPALALPHGKAYFPARMPCARGAHAPRALARQSSDIPSGGWRHFEDGPMQLTDLGRTARCLATCAAAFLLAGCASTLALDRMVLAYDQSTTDSVSKQLLLNIARARYSQPIHFTSVSSITATYRFAVNAGIGGAITGERGGLLVPSLAGTAEENPTVSIAPMQGDEFTQRLLTPFEEQKLTLLLRQGYDVDSLLRLMGNELRLQEAGSEEIGVHYNRPSDPQGYTVFRRVMAHLSSIQDRHALHVEPLFFQRTWTVPAEQVTPESFQALYKDFSLRSTPDRRGYAVSRPTMGRIMITNFNPGVLSNAERLELHAQAEDAPTNEILLDIRAGHPGGEYPLKGRLRLRSFHEVLTFLGRGMQEEPEFDVAPDPRTPLIRENPTSTLKIHESSRPQQHAEATVAYKGRYFSIGDDDGYPWDKKVFSLLYQLFQMTVAPSAQSGPAITIAK
jgi:hypothetical protein